MRESRSNGPLASECPQLRLVCGIYRREKETADFWVVEGITNEYTQISDLLCLQNRRLRSHTDG